MVVRLKDAGDLLASKAQTIVNTVNCRGVMGKGVAAAFRDSGVYDKMVADYEQRCAAGKVRLGQPYLWRPSALTQGSEQGTLLDEETLEPAPSLLVKQVLNFPTKDHWKQRHSRLSDIDRGLTYAASQRCEWGIKSMAVPALGCGNGRLSWPLICDTLQDWLETRFPEVDVDLHAPPDEAGGPTRASGPGWIEPGWIDMAEAMAKAGKMLAGQDGQVKEVAKAVARACGELPGLDGVRTEYFSNVRKRLANNGVIGYGQDWPERGPLNVTDLLAPGPTFNTSIAWRREQGDPDEAAIRQAAEMLVEQIERSATSRARSDRPLSD